MKLAITAGEGWSFEAEGPDAEVILRYVEWRRMLEMMMPWTAKAPYKPSAATSADVQYKEPATAGAPVS